MLYEVVDTPCTVPGVMGRATQYLIVIPAREAFNEFAAEHEGDLRSRLREKANKNVATCRHATFNTLWWRHIQMRMLCVVAFLSMGSRTPRRTGLSVCGKCVS